jgi:hypothetical protein
LPHFAGILDCAKKTIAKEVHYVGLNILLKHPALMFKKLGNTISICHLQNPINQYKVLLGESCYFVD